MENYLKLSRCYVVSLAMLFAPIHSAVAGAENTGHKSVTDERKVPVGIKVNKIINEHLPDFADKMNLIISKGPTDKDLLRFSPEDQRIFKALMAGLKSREARFVAVEDKVEFYSTDGKSTIELKDYFNGKFKVDGKLYSYKRGETFKSNLITAGGLFHKKTTSLFNFLIMDEAYALAPLLVIPGWVWLTGAAAGGVSFFADTVVSAGLNDIQNTDFERRIQRRIAELETTYNERANVCEADLAQARVQTGARLTGNNTIRMVGALIEGLGAELEDTFMDFDGKEEIDYDDFGCEAYDGHVVQEANAQNGDRELKISNTQVIGLWSGFNPHGQVLKKLCDHQDRLNRCFSDTEEVMRENDLSINDLAGPDRVGPYDGLLDDYIELDGASRR